MAMHCLNCHQNLQETWYCCPFCGMEVGKAGGIDDNTLRCILSTRKDTLDILKSIIDDLEKYGKFEAASSLVSTGANIASGLLWMFVPAKPVAVFADVVSSGLSIANSGVSLLSVWAENGLLGKADEVCKLDKMYLLRLRTVVPAVAEMFAKRSTCTSITPKVFRAKVKELITVYKSDKWQAYSYQPQKKELGVSVLANLAVFIGRGILYYNGKYSSVAERLKAERKILLIEYETISSAPQDILDIIRNKMLI